MALSTCIKGGGRFFQGVVAEPSDLAYRVIFVQCSSCGGVVGTLPFFDPGVLAKRVEGALKQIASHLNIYIDWDRL